MEIYLLILIALIIYCCIRFDDLGLPFHPVPTSSSISTRQQDGGSGETDFRKCGEITPNTCAQRYKVSPPQNVQREDPLIRYGRHPWEKPAWVACRHNVQCQSGKCDGYFCT